MTPRGLLHGGAAFLAALTACVAAPPPPSTIRCQVRSGSVTGAPRLELGGGEQAFEPRPDGVRWSGAQGPQGGQHVWVSVRSRGLGPEVTVRWEMGPLDGGAYRPWSQRTACLEAADEDGVQELVGVPAQLALGPPHCSPEVCGDEPFVLRVKLFDDDGKSAVESRVVAGVDLGIPDPCARDGGAFPDGGDPLCRSLAAEFNHDAGPF